METLGNTKLPTRNAGGFIAFVDNHGLSTLVLIGILGYTAIVLIFSFAQWLGILFGTALVVHNGQSVGDFFELLYFNFVTILTLGYGDYVPEGIGRLLAILEAFVGVALFGSWLGAVTLKLAVPSKDSVVFSKYAFYDLDRECFVVQLANTHRVPMVHVQYSAAIKINRRVGSYPTVTEPYFYRVWTRPVAPLSIGDIASVELGTEDGLRFAISGNYGFASYAATISYSFDDIWVLPSTAQLGDDAVLNRGQLSSPDFAAVFHYKPKEATSFREFASSRGATVIGTQPARV